MAIYIPDHVVNDIITLKATLMKDDPSLIEPPLKDTAIDLVRAYVAELFPKSHDELWEACRVHNRPPVREARIRITANNFNKVVSTINTLRRLDRYVTGTSNTLSKYNQQILVLAAMIQDAGHPHGRLPDYMNVAKALSLLLPRPIHHSRNDDDLVTMTFFPDSSPNDTRLVWDDMGVNTRDRSINATIVLGALINDTINPRSSNIPTDGGVAQLSWLFYDLTYYGLWLSDDWFEQVIEGMVNVSAGWSLMPTVFDDAVHALCGEVPKHIQKGSSSPVAADWIAHDPMIRDVIVERYTAVQNALRTMRE